MMSLCIHYLLVSRPFPTCQRSETSPGGQGWQRSATFQGWQAEGEPEGVTPPPPSLVRPPGSSRHFLPSCPAPPPPGSPDTRSPESGAEWQLGAQRHRRLSPQGQRSKKDPPHPQGLKTQKMKLIYSLNHNLDFVLTLKLNN